MPSKTKSTNSKKTKKGFSWRKLSLTTRKSRLIASVLIITVMGAGYLTYKSFAAPPTQSWTYSIGSYNLSSTLMPSKSSCSKSPYTETQKNSIQVWSIACPTSRNTNTINEVQVDILGSNLPAGWDSGYIVCALVKGTGKFSVIGAGRDARGQYPENVNDYEINSSSYKSYCSPGFWAYTPSKFFGAVRMRNATKAVSGGGWINVAYITLEKIATK